MEVSTEKCLEIWHSYVRKWKTSQSLSFLTENVMVNFNSVTQTIMPDKIIIYIAVCEIAGNVEYLAQELSRILFYWFMFSRTLSASHVKCYQSIAVNSN